ncbi:MAG: helix-turn-helix transcriptional regulator [Deltaproteobacteria bacterium]|nr:helix-turn-helix transcriptional regulator [Deltaproteobacteria bacterium]
MGLLDGFEKLINEHGSATILRERIALANDKFSSLEQKLFDSELREKNLNSENKALKSDLEKATKEINRLTKIIESSQKEQSVNKPKEIEEQILKHFFDTNQEFYVSNIASRFNISVGVAEYHINNLKKVGFIGDLLSSMDNTRYYITDRGREYIVANT